MERDMGQIHKVDLVEDDICSPHQFEGLVQMEGGLVAVGQRTCHSIVANYVELKHKMYVGNEGLEQQQNL